MNKLDKIALNYEETQNEWKSLQIAVRTEEYNLFKNYAFEFDNVLEIGLGDGVFTNLLSADFKEVFALDGSKFTIRALEKQLHKKNNIKFIHSYMEDFLTSKKFDNIVMSHVLEHLEDPFQSLMKIKDLIHDNSIIYISVPNSESIHRQVAVEMGLLEKTDELTPLDLKLGHFVVFNLESLKNLAFSAGFEIIHYGGIMLKPLTNRQIVESWSDDMIAGFIKLGHKFPQLCGDVFVILRNIKERKV